MRWDLTCQLKWMKGDMEKVLEVNMDLNSMVPTSTKVVDKESYTWLAYLVDNAQGKHH